MIRWPFDQRPFDQFWSNGRCRAEACSGRPSGPGFPPPDQLRGRERARKKTAAEPAPGAPRSGPPPLFPGKGAAARSWVRPGPAPRPFSSGPSPCPATGQVEENRVPKGVPSTPRPDSGHLTKTGQMAAGQKANGSRGPRAAPKRPRGTACSGPPGPFLGLLTTFGSFDQFWGLLTSFGPFDQFWGLLTSFWAF